MSPRLLSLVVLCALASFGKNEVVQVVDKEGRVMEGSSSLNAITVGGRKVPLAGVLSVHSGEPASATETARIEKGLAAIQAYKNEIIGSPERKSRDAAVEDLTTLGLPVLTPLLNTLKDTDQHEPRPLYRLFERVIPSEADQLDRTASLVRLANGKYLRGKVEPFTLEVNGQKIEWANVRRLAVRRKMVTRNMEVHSLRHSTQIEYMDTGVVLSGASAVTARAKGFVRLSWAEDGWTSDAAGLKVPGPRYKTNLVDGHPFGALVGRVTAAGEVFVVGTEFSKKGLAAGRLHLAVNDNRHWQNNLGTFRVLLQAADAYDVGAAQ
jgi:hypothetical protein